MKRQICFSLVFALMFSFIFIFETFSQKGGKGRYRKVPLTKDARKNGYTVTQQGREEYFLLVNNAEDPLTKKRLEGEKEVEFRCNLNDPVLRKLMRFTKGTSERVKIECLVIIKPQIIIARD